MNALSLWKTRCLLKRLRRDVLLQSSRLQQMHPLYYWDAESCRDTTAVRPGEENHVLDGDRPMVDRRDLLESELQKLVRKAFFYGYYKGLAGYFEPPEHLSEYNKELHELLVSYFDSSSSDVGAQDEAAETRTMGDGVRPEGYLKIYAMKPNGFDEYVPKYVFEKHNDDGSVEYHTEWGYISIQ